jgi:leader peptidase (prepilin peptidase)/N-methyltransferase
MLPQYVFLFLLGSAIGSFLNVCIYRLPRGESVIYPPSHCPSCGRRLRFWENIPLVSFFILSRRCAGCGTAIAWRYPLVEALAGGVLVGLFHVHGFSWDWARYSMLYLLLIPIAFIDLDHRLILNKLTYPGIIVGLCMSMVAAPEHYWRPLFGMIAGGGFLYGVGLLGLSVFKQESMGGGDVKLGAMAGAFMDASAVLAALFLAFLFAATVAILGMASGRLGRRSTIPFGPFIALAVATFVLFGNELGQVYRNVMSF